MRTTWKRGLLILIVILVLLLGLPYLIPLPAGQPATALADAAGRFVTVEGLQTYVLEAGPPEGPAVVLIHGLGGSTFSWRETIDPLADAGYHVIAFDLPGFGLTDKPLAYDYGHPHQADFTAHLLDALDVSTATLVGHSMGGNIIAHLALRHPERVERLVFVDGAVVGSGGGPGNVGALAAFPPIARWIEVAGAYLLTPERFTDLLRSAYADPDFVTPEIAAGYARVLQTPDFAAGLVGLVRDAGQNQLPEEAIRQIAAPSLLAWGEADTWVPLVNGQRLLALLPDAVLRTYPASDICPWKKPRPPSTPICWPFWPGNPCQADRDRLPRPGIKAGPPKKVAPL